MHLCFHRFIFRHIPQDQGATGTRGNSRESCAILVFLPNFSPFSVVFFFAFNHMGNIQNFFQKFFLLRADIHRIPKFPLSRLLPPARHAKLSLAHESPLPLPSPHPQLRRVQPLLQRLPQPGRGHGQRAHLRSALARSSHTNMRRFGKYQLLNYDAFFCNADCTPPFRVDVRTNAVSDTAANANNAQRSRGACVN